MKYSGKIIMTLMLCSALAGLFVQCTQTKAIVKTIGSTESVELIKKNSKNTKFIILDVRTPQEFAEGHIANATNIDVKADDFAEKIGKLDKSRKYLVYCRSGHRSANAVEIMRNHSFKTIYNLDGGIIRWMSEQNPVVK